MNTQSLKSARTPHTIGVICWLTWALFSPTREAEAIGRLQFLGEARLEQNLSINGARVGGLSGIAYDPRTDLYFAISDDPGIFSSARLFTLKIDLSNGTLGPGDVVVNGVTYLQSRSGQHFPSGSIDAEGIAYTRGGTLIVSSEGQAKDLIDPFVMEFRSDGSYLRSIKIPKKYSPRRRRTKGVRHNLAFESLSLSPSGKSLYTATENALIQDGPESDLGVQSPSRILRYDTMSGKLLAEYLYLVDEVAQPPQPADDFRVNGLVDLLGLDETTLLALERSYSAGVGNDVRLYLARLRGATDIRKRKSLRGQFEKTVPVAKELVFDFAQLDTDLDNFEGLTWGPVLDDGRRTILLVTDDNFNPAHQVTQFFAFAVDLDPVTIPEIQGNDHRSPLENTWVRDVPGVVTNIARARDSSDSNAKSTATVLWIQAADSDGDLASADGLVVNLKNATAPPGIAPGDHVLTTGRVSESGRTGELTVTRIVDAEIQIEASNQPLPLPIVIGREGRSPPTGHVDDDGLSDFEPDEDAIDFYESLEGMRIALQDPVVVGASSRYGEITVVADRGATSQIRSSRGGLLIGPGDTNPERIQVVLDGFIDPAQFNVGDQFLGPITGVLDYAFASFRIIVTDPLPQVERSDPWQSSTAVSRDDDSFALATFNVQNLGVQSAEEKFKQLAQIVVANLSSPDLVALQEIQDNSGPEDDGTVSADQTFGRLIAAIAQIGGPDYSYTQIDPIDGQDGGQPGSNIRVGYLFNRDRIRFESIQSEDEHGSARFRLDGKVPGLHSNPSLLGLTSPAFAEDLQEGLHRSRKPLLAEFWVGQHQIFVVNVHLNSKRSDQPLFGGVQPPQRFSEQQRTLQIQVIADAFAQLFKLNPQANVIVLGDFNDHEFRPTLEPLRRLGFENLIDHVPAADRYTYVYKGNSQVLDQVLVSPHLTKIASPEVTIQHINADFSAQTRSSDHDPILVRLSLDHSTGE
jgi:predicted extracellular nuclease